MADVHSSDIRSKNMAAIKSKGNRSTELLFLTFLRDSGIKGWRRHYNRIPGKPDFSFPLMKVAVFLDGCYWHGCPVCYKSPATNAQFWSTKIRTNRLRDKKVNTLLSAKKWTVIRIWEHELKKNPNDAVTKLAEIF